MSGENEALLDVILDKTSNESSLIASVQRLQSLRESRDFWVNIINDETYSSTHRRVAFVQYFVRHSFKKRLRELMLNSTNLSHFNLQMKIIGVFTGIMPVHDPPENDVVRIDCDFDDAGSATIYISVFPKIEDSETSGALLVGVESSQIVTDVAACELLPSGAYINWKRWQQRQVYELFCPE